MIRRRRQTAGAGGSQHVRRTFLDERSFWMSDHSGQHTTDFFITQSEFRFTLFERYPLALVPALPSASCACLLFLSRVLPFLRLKRSASSETGLDVVPPFQFIAFADLPAQQHYSAISQGGKVDQAAIKVFKLNSQLFKFTRLGR